MEKKSPYKVIKEDTQLAKDSPYEFLVNLTGFLVNGFGLTYGLLISEHGEGIFYYRGWPGKLKYLTFWNQIIQTVYFAISLMKNVYINRGNAKSTAALQKKIDIDGQIIIKRQKRDKLHRFRDAFHGSIVFPIGAFVVVTFWILYAINRELVFPKDLDKVVPPWQNHISHTYPLVILLFEKCFVAISYKKRKRGLAFTMGFAAVYQIWILWIAYYTDIWVYPVLRALDWPKRILFFCSLYVMLFTLYMIGECISWLCWQSNIPIVAKRRRTGNNNV